MLSTLKRTRARTFTIVRSSGRDIRTAFHGAAHDECATICIGNEVNAEEANTVSRCSPYLLPISSSPWSFENYRFARANKFEVRLKNGNHAK